MLKQKPAYIELKCILPHFSPQGRDDLMPLADNRDKMASTPEISDMLTAGLLTLGYEGFIPEERYLFAYITEDLFSETSLNELDIIRKMKIEFEFRLLENKNWNEEWEKNFTPVTITKECLVRAPFHLTCKKYPLEIIIEPKMAFGTGHHPTTAMIAEYLIENKPKGLYLFDMGCGSGILGILAWKTGADKVEMADNDPDAVANAMENIIKNNALPVKVWLGGKELLKNRNPGMITANIIKSVLMDHMSHYFKALLPGGILVVSGIIEPDLDDMLYEATNLGFILLKKVHKQEWLMLAFKKPENI